MIHYFFHILKNIKELCWKNFAEFVYDIDIVVSISEKMVRHSSSANMTLSLLGSDMRLR